MGLAFKFLARLPTVKKSTISYLRQGEAMAGGRYQSGNGRSIRRRIETMQRKRLASQKVVDLGTYRGLHLNRQTATILVVDDDEIMRNALKRILEMDGYSVMLAEDGMELSAILENSRLDLVLLDVNLPWVDGIELCQLLKSSPAYRHVPLVMVSAKTKKEDIETAFDAGCDDYITKPFDVEKLTDVIRANLAKSNPEHF